jgi:hypothetical protein
MKDVSRLEEVRKATAEAVAKYRAKREALAAKAARPPRPGDVYLLPGSSIIDLRWVVLTAPPDKDLLFAVPADGHPLVGLTDVEVSAESAGGPLVLRCGHGLWVHREEFRSESRVDTLDPQHVHQALDKLGQVAGGSLRGPASQKEAEANPDYDDWLAEVEKAVDAVASALRLREETLTAADFGPSLVLPGASPLPEDAEPQFALAAASSGALAQLFEALALQPETRPPVRPVSYPYPGDLFLLLEADGVAVVYLPQGEQTPPELRGLGTAGDTVPAEWLITPGGTACRAFFPWDESQVRLRFGQGEQARTVTIRKG